MDRDEDRGLLAAEVGKMTREQGHALNNIFSTIIANAEMVGEEVEPGGQVQRRLERIVEACRRGEELVQTIRRSENVNLHAQSRRADERPAPALSPGRILVVDDEEDIVAIISRYLIKEGFVVQGMTDSQRALERIQANPFAFDLLLTDVDMPSPSGIDLCRQVRALRSDVQVVMITGYDRRISAEHLAELEVGELLMKPLSRQVLLAAVHRLLTP